MSDALVDAYDGVLLDLDGVLYRGPAPVPGAPEAMARLRRRGLAVGFVTNNAARTPATVAAHLTALGIEAHEGEVITAAQAGVRLLTDTCAADARVLVVGTDALAELVRDAGHEVVGRAEDADVVIQGFDPDLTWAGLTEAALAVQRGARWIATNTDSTRPIDRGIAPGNGAAVAVVAAACPGAEPLVAGKPRSALLHESLDRLGVTRCLFVGDRLDTDVDGARGVGIDSALVLTGAHGRADVAARAAVERPTHVIETLAGLFSPAEKEPADD